MRAGFLYPTEQQFQTMFVCPRHRANLGEYWGNQSRSSAWQYPEHRGKKKGVKNDRVVSVKIAREVQQMFAVIIPVGMAICNSCRKRHNEKLKEYQSSCLEEDDTQDDGLKPQ
ncbi:Hypothetical predicted protein [Paramuricea clavata]|uniref:Uncharacterized protein n=1 Tax=Paramuricea clavata TaxID=317549 RepID=A0A6S7HJE3_PARCT|nr:Hypothetical predicted protein [Paramuricea clavata]